MMLSATVCTIGILFNKINAFEAFSRKILSLRHIRLNAKVNCINADSVNIYSIRFEFTERTVE